MTAEPAECPIDFNTFVLSLSSNALAVHPDQVAAQAGTSDDNRDSRSAPLRLALAKQTVDILEMLEEKTHGNLSGEEERLLHQVLRDVREHLQGIEEARAASA